MADYDAVNRLLWHVVNSCGWWLWGPIAVAAWLNLCLMGRLAPPITHLGRTARIINTVGYWLLVVSPLMNVAGALALPLLVVGWSIVHWQMWRQCVREGKAVGGTLLERVVFSLVRPSA